MELTYREGTIADQEQLRELAIISYGHFEQALTRENWHSLYENLASEKSYSSILEIARCFVCEMENSIIGVAYLVPSGNPTDIFESTWSYIRMVGVHPAYRGRGIGKNLTQQCIAFARQNEEQVIALHTSEFMDSARSLYEKLGFSRVKEIDPIFGKKYWLYQLELN